MRWIVCLAVVLAACMPTGRVIAQIVAIPDAPQVAPERPRERVVEMTVTPAAPPRPAMRYRLLPDVREQRPGNAATGLLLAMRMVPEGIFRQEGEEERMAELQRLPVDQLPVEEARRIVYQYLSLEHLERIGEAVRRTETRWDLPVREQGIFTVLPHLNDMRSFGRLIAWHARIQVAEGDYAQATHTLQTGLALARHLDSEPMLVQSLVGIGIAQLMLQEVRELMLQPDGPNLYWALADLPRPMFSFREAMRSERLWIMPTFPELEQVKAGRFSADDWHRFYQRLAQVGAISGPINDGDAQPITGRLAPVVAGAMLYPSARDFLLREGYAAEEVDQMPVAQALGLFMILSYEIALDDVIKWSATPYWQAQAPMLEVEQTFQRAAYTENPLASILLPAVRAAYQRFAVNDREFALLQTVEALRAYAAANDGRLPESLDQIRDTPVPPFDPVTGRPFGYRAEGNSVTISAEAIDAYRAFHDNVRYRVTFRPIPGD